MPDSPQPDSAREKFYLTTPIYYVNARPHIGHAYSTIVADVLARRHRLLGHDTFFLTGTDEHGQKIERSAAAAGIPPQQFADEVSQTFRDLWQRMGITNDAFIRTTDPHHIRGVQKLFADLYAKGHIYLSTYTGQYSVGEEMFVDGPPGTIGPDGRPTETVTEENFFFRLSNFQQTLLDLIESNTLRITPDASRNEVLSFVRAGLKDVSVSRSSFTWGVPVPDTIQQQAGATQPHVIYVWFDALINYMTAIGYGSEAEPDKDRFARYWPADLHLVGKEITRFHCVFWPAFLLAANLPVPRQVTANGWLLFDNSKMSKSKGNVVRTETILDAFGEHVYQKQFPDSTKKEQDLFAADVLRYFLLREIPFGQDGTFSFESMVTRYNADLVNGYGNLVKRALSMVEQYFNHVLPDPSSDSVPLIRVRANYYVDLHYGTMDEEFHSFDQLASSSRLDNLDFNAVLQKAMGLIALTDAFLSKQAPWKSASGESEEDLLNRRKAVLFGVAEDIRIITALLYPILPNAAAKVWHQLGLGDIQLASDKGELRTFAWGGLKPGTKLGPLAPIFPRADKSLPQIMADIEAARTTQPPTEVPTMPTTTPTPDTSQQPANPETHPAEPLKDQGDPNPAANPEPSSPTPKRLFAANTAPPVPLDPTHPGAPPRTTSADLPSPGTTVAGSHAITTEREGTPPHAEAAASGIFAGAPSAESAQIAIDDFIKIDLRAARILVAERIPKADKLLRLEVDLGTEQRQILSGIAEWYTPEELVGRTIVVIANLAPRKMRGLLSHGMLLAASEAENTKPILATFAEGIAPGTRLK